MYTKAKTVELQRSSIHKKYRDAVSVVLLPLERQIDLCMYVSAWK